MTLPKSPSFRLDGRPVLVTGASSGIGAGCAVALGEMGTGDNRCPWPGKLDAPG